MRVAQLLLVRDDEVIGVANLKDDYGANVKKAYLARLAKFPGPHF